MLRKEITGYAAFDKESGRGLGIQYGITNRLFLTDDPDKVNLASEEMIKTHIIWFNNTHKNQKEFEIKKVVRVTEVLEDTRDEV